MSKRFIDTDIWKKKWFQELSPAQKCFWFYLFTNCDNAGVWEKNIPLAEFLIGCKVTDEDLKTFESNLEELKEDKVFIPGFIPFQYGELTENCKPHKQIFALLEKHDIKIQRVSKGYPKGIHTLQDKDKDILSSSSSSSHEDKERLLIPPSFEQVKNYCEQRNNGVDPEKFINHYTSKGWMVGKSKMKDWQASIRTWEKSTEKTTRPKWKPQ